MNESSFKNLMKMSAVHTRESFTPDLMQRIVQQETERRRAAEKLRHQLMVVLPLAILLVLAGGVCVYLLQDSILHLAGKGAMRLFQLITTAGILFSIRELIALRQRSLSVGESNVQKKFLSPGEAE
ncbi:hypothetical protein AB9P05_23740 [Roseivirga sp. BDSF3-8]|uniref:hypothetical protein n=1 Tax=Roseivirga sp. BDSF3-8 TaxID=3241598 RepID=UPI00353210E8